MKQSDLFLSAQRALLGRIHPNIRLIKIKSEGLKIVVTVLVEGEPSEKLLEDISEATTEIIADFPEAQRISEKIERFEAEIGAEDIFEEGWIFRRAE